MDRRQRKTREAILSAFSELLKKHKYESITVQDIIDRADVGRSTFYSHFETKDTLLKVICDDIFTHIIDGESCELKEDSDTLLSRLTHILRHFDGKKDDIRAILSSQSRDVFMKYLRDYLDTVFGMHLSEFHTDVPTDYLKNHLICSFCETVRWWVDEAPDSTPEETAAFYMSVTEKH